MIRKAVIPAAGLGTRLLSATKGQPKEMLPVFAKDLNGMLCVKPVVQEIFERLFSIGIRKFCFIVGKEKRAIQQHFATDPELVDHLNSLRKNNQALRLQSFFRKIKESEIVWLDQPEPRGFGDAVLRAEHYVRKESFLVNAGDSFVASEVNEIPRLLAEAHKRSRADATLTLKEVENPSEYGVAEVFEIGEQTFVKSVVEKPAHPTSRLAIVALYAFSPAIFTALRDTQPGRGGEIQLTDAIQTLIDSGRTVQAVKMHANDIHADIGNPDSYWEALKLSHHIACGKARIEIRPHVTRFAGESHLSAAAVTFLRETYEGHTCLVCKDSSPQKDDILCADCSRALTLILGLLRDHPELTVSDLQRIRGASSQAKKMELPSPRAEP